MIDIKNRADLLISKNDLVDKIFLLRPNDTQVSPPLQARCEKNKNENIQFTPYFWKLGLDLPDVPSKLMGQLSGLPG